MAREKTFPTFLSKGCCVISYQRSIITLLFWVFLWATDGTQRIHSPASFFVHVSGPEFAGRWKILFGSPKVTGDSERPESWHTPGSGQRDHQGRGLSGNNIVQSQQDKRNQLHSCVYSRNDSLAPIMCLIQLLEGAMEAEMSQTDQNPCPCGASLWARTWAETKLLCSNKWDKAPLPEPSGGQHLDGPPYGSASAQAVTPSHQTSGWATMAHFPLISQIDLFQHWIDNHLFVSVSFTHSAKTYWATWAGCWATSWELGCGRASSPCSHEALILVRGADHTSVNRYLCLIMPGGEKYCEEKEVKRWRGESGSDILDG